MTAVERNLEECQEKLQNGVISLLGTSPENCREEKEIERSRR